SASPLALMVLPYYREHEPKPPATCGHKAEDGQPWVTENLERSRHAHEQSRANNQRREDQPHRDAVRQLLKTFQKKPCFRRPHFDVQFRIANRIQDLVQPGRKGAKKLFSLQQCRKYVAFSKYAFEPLVEDFAGVAAN